MFLELHNDRYVKIPNLFQLIPNNVEWSRISFVLVKHKKHGYLQIVDGQPKYVQSSNPYDTRHLRLYTGSVELDKLPNTGSPSLAELRSGEAQLVPVREEICWMYVGIKKNGTEDGGISKRYAKEWVANSKFTIPNLSKIPVKKGYTFRGWSYNGIKVDENYQFNPEDAGGTIWADFVENFE